MSGIERNNLQVFHSFAGNTLDRSEVERRSPDWISSLINHPSTKFLLVKDFMFPVFENDDLSIESTLLSLISSTLKNH